MKTSRFALVLTLLLAVAVNFPADARPMGHFGTSSGLKSGFSSQKGNAFRSVRPSAPMAAPTNGPGAFGAAAGAAGAAKSASPLSRDLDQSAAQANATKTLDARRAASAVPPASTVPPQADPLRPQPAPGAYSPGAYYPQPIYVQRHDSGWMPMWMGFMLGRSLSGGHQTVYYNNNGAYVDPNNAGYGNNSNVANTSGNGDNGGNVSGNNASGGGEDWDSIHPIGATVAGGGAAIPAVPAAPTHSLGNAVLRGLAWLAFVGTMLWVLRVIFKRMLRNRAAANYSFERN